METNRITAEQLRLRVARCGQFPSRRIEGEGMVVSTQKGAAILLNGVGFELWNWIDDQRTGDDLLNKLCETYEVEKQQAQSDLLEFLGRLTELQLVELQTAGSK